MTLGWLFKWQLQCPIMFLQEAQAYGSIKIRTQYQQDRDNKEGRINTG
jgi:hypothetical protein